MAFTTRLNKGPDSPPRKILATQPAANKGYCSKLQSGIFNVRAHADVNDRKCIYTSWIFKASSQTSLVLDVSRRNELPKPMRAVVRPPAAATRHPSMRRHESCTQRAVCGGGNRAASLRGRVFLARRRMTIARHLQFKRSSRTDGNADLQGT